MHKKQVEKERVYLAYTSALLSISEGNRTGTQTGQDSKTGVNAEVMEESCLLACFQLSPPSNRTQDQLLRDGNTHYGLVLPSKIT